MSLLKAFAFSIALAAIMVACGRLREMPVVDFAMKDLKMESTPGCSEKDSCAIFEVRYPVFLSLDTTVRAAINDRIAFIVNGSVGEQKSLEEIGNDFVKEFNDFRKEMPDYDMSWYQRGTADVLIASDTLISLQVSVETYTGAASASYTTNFVNIDPKTGTAYLLDAMLRAGYEDELNRLALEDVREQMGFESDSIGSPEVPWEKFKLNDNYGFRKEGIVFVVYPDELSSFPTDGFLEILIPYEKLQEWIR